MSTEIWLAQFLCPSRHCIVAMAYDPAEFAGPQVEAQILHAMKLAGVRPTCGICQSTTLRFEHARTVFRDWETASRELQQMQTEQLLTRWWLDEAQFRN